MRDYQQWLLSSDHSKFQHLGAESQIKCTYPMDKKGTLLLNLKQDYHFVCKSPVIQGSGSVRVIPVKTGADLTLKCEVDASPRPMIYFTLPDKITELHANYHGRLNFSNYQVEDVPGFYNPDKQISEFSVLLHISNVTKEQAGDYTCNISGLKSHCTDSRKECKKEEKSITYKLGVYDKLENGSDGHGFSGILILLVFAGFLLCLFVKLGLIKSQFILSLLNSCEFFGKRVFDELVRCICVFKNSRRQSSRGFAPLREEEDNNQNVFDASLEGEELASINRERETEGSRGFRPKILEKQTRINPTPRMSKEVFDANRSKFDNNQEVFM